MDGLLDTSIVVDLLRSYEPAGTWLAGRSRLGISSVVWLEVIEGAKNLRAQARAVALLGRFEKVEILPGDFDWAIRQALQFRLSHNIGMMDCLIASTAQRLGVTLFTPNLKHFQPLIGALAQRPY